MKPVRMSKDSAARLRVLSILCLFLVVGAFGSGLRGESSKSMRPEIVTYKTVGDIALDMHIFRPEAARNRTAVVFFVCGGWRGFNPEKYYALSSYFVSRGAVCFTALVRVERHGTSPAECVTDARSAIRWVRAHAAEYGINPKRLVVMGSSAAGHVSASTALLDDFDDLSDDLSISARPDAVMIICPVLVITNSERRVSLFGGMERAKALSPIAHVKRGAPPFLVIHGTADEVVLADEAIQFSKRMNALGNRCDLRLHPGKGHGFHNFKPQNLANFRATARDMDEFLASLGFLEGIPTIDNFIYE